MPTKRIFQSLIVVAILAASFARAGVALAWSGCTAQITVQAGETLSSIAARCSTTTGAIQAVNPGLGWWVYAGQVLTMPMAATEQAGSTYVVQWGDTLGNIAARFGVSLSDILAVNPQIWNASLIFPGQVINLPATVNGALTLTYVWSSSPASSTQFSDLKVTSVPGLLVRAGPGRNFSLIMSPLVSAVKGSTWRYRKSTVTLDSTGLVWAEIALPQTVNGYSTGWILVRDQLGSHFTDPKIDP